MIERSEARARAEICRYAALAWKRGLVAGTSGNLSLRLPDGGILVTPASRSLRELAPSDLVALQADGTPRPGASGRATSELPLHLAAYRVRPSCAAVVHLHPTHAVAWTKRGRLFPLDTVGAIESLGAVTYTPYAPAGSHALAECCAAAFADGALTVVMERHGLSSIGETLAEAFDRADLAEQTAAIETAAATLVLAGRRLGESAGEPSGRDRGDARRGGRAAECTRLESEQTFTGLGSSNLPLSESPSP